MKQTEDPLYHMKTAISLYTLMKDVSLENCEQVSEDMSDLMKEYHYELAKEDIIAVLISAVSIGVMALNRMGKDRDKFLQMIASVPAQVKFGEDLPPPD